MRIPQSFGHSFNRFVDCASVPISPVQYGAEADLPRCLYADTGIDRWCYAGRLKAGAKSTPALRLEKHWRGGSDELRVLTLVPNVAKGMRPLRERVAEGG